MSNETGSTYETVENFGEVQNYHTSNSPELTLQDITGNVADKSKPIVPGSVIADTYLLGYGYNTLGIASSAYTDSIAPFTESTQDIDDVTSFQDLENRSDVPLITGYSASNNPQGETFSQYQITVEPKGASGLIGAFLSSYGFARPSADINVAVQTDTIGYNNQTDDFLNFF